MHEFIFTWSIDNIRSENSWYRSRQELVSPLFVADTLQNTAWSLKLYLYFLPKVEIRDDLLRLFLIRRKDNVPRDFSFNCDFSIVTANNLALTSVHSESTVGEFGMGFKTVFRNYDVFDQKALFWPQGTLTLRCRLWKCEGDFDQFGQCFARTRLRVERILSFADMNPRTISNKTILIHSKNQNKLLLLSVDVFHEKDCLKVELRRRNTAKFNFSTFNISAVGRNRTGINYEDSWYDMPNVVAWTMPFSDADNKASVKNKLKLRCEFTYSTGEDTNSVEKFSPCSLKFPEFSSNSVLSCIPSGKLSDCPSICKDLWDLYSNQILCDVELKTLTFSFWVHKAVLCARSPVFLAMFTNKRKENKSNCVEIDDLENYTLEKFISFLYTDNFEESEWNAVEKLYYVADKYQVELLKYYCCYFFLNSMDDLNVCELLMLADKHSDRSLKYKAADYIVRHEERVFSSSTWKKFSEKEPLLFAKTKLFKYEEDRKNRSEKSKLYNYPKAIDDFRSLYQTQVLSDIVIYCNSYSFNAHKTMLCAGSSTLRRIITRRESTVSLKTDDLEDDNVSRLLLFLYTDSLEGIKWEDATKLYHAAVVNQIERLKVKCSCFFVENLKASNATDLLKLAQEHRDVNLKSLAEDFISLHNKEITFPEGLSETGKTDPPIRMETRLSKRLKLDDKS